MDLHQLRSLVAVAEAGSVTAAARRLLLTQPAVTRQILALEEELGGALFDRSKKPITPTPLGRSALEQARRILQMSEDLRATISSDAGTLRGELRLGVGPSFAREVVPPLVLALRRHYPGVELRLSVNFSGALTRQVEDGLIDAVVVLRLPHMRLPAALATTRLGTEQVVLISSTKTPLKGTVPLEALREVGWVINPEGCGFRNKLKRLLEEGGIPFRVVVETADTESELQLQLIREGVGAGIVPTRDLPPRLATAGLQTFRIGTANFSHDVWLVHRRTGPIVPVVMPVIEQTVARVLARKTDSRHRPASRERRRWIRIAHSESGSP
ncbi:MAG: LysR family transcriptional regulator [candidate division NC10 bacterium]|nr:LysR family transcriptional regulator [candidate division NC10 bacterium]